MSAVISLRRSAAILLGCRAGVCVNWMRNCQILGKYLRKSQCNQDHAITSYTLSVGMERGNNCKNLFFEAFPLHCVPHTEDLPEGGRGHTEGPPQPIQVWLRRQGGTPGGPPKNHSQTPGRNRPSLRGQGLATLGLGATRNGFLRFPSIPPVMA